MSMAVPSIPTGILQPMCLPIRERSLSSPGKGRRRWKKEKLSASVTPVLTENGQQLIGVQFQPGIEPADTLLELMRQSVYEVQFWIRYVFDTFYMMFHGAVSVDDISGPVGIVSTIDQTVDEASQAGAGAVAMTLVNFGVLLSANLGVMNLIPFPALDGGRLFFLFWRLFEESLLTRKRKP